MKSIKKTLNLYLPFTRAGMKIELAYKAQIVMWGIISFCEVFFILFLYRAIYKSSEGGMSSVINGFTYNDMVLYMITSFLFSFIMGSGDTSYNIFTDVREGTISSTLTKPVSYRLRHLFTYFGVLTLDFLVVIVPIMTAVYAVFIATGLLEVTAGSLALNILFFLVFSIIAGFINDAISYFIGMMVFYTDHLFGLNMIRSTLEAFLGGKMIPLAYMGTLGVIFSFTPFAFMNSVPVLTIMGKLDIPSILGYLVIAMAWLFVIELANHLLFKRAIKKLTVQGG